jgi:hypothetical protein
MFGDMKSIAENYNGIARNYDTSVDGVVSELLENKITLARLTSQIDFILTNMANNPDFLKNTGIWEDFVEHQEAFDQAQQELDEEYQRGGSTTPTTQQQHETKQEGDWKHPTEHEYKDGKNKSDVQESQSNNRQDTAPVTPHIHSVITTRQTEITSEILYPQKNTEPIDLTNPPTHLSQSPPNNKNTPSGSPNTPSTQKLHQPQAIQASYAPGFNPLETTFVQPSLDKTKTGPGIAKKSADDAPQKTPYPTKDNKNTETSTQEKKKQENCASCNTKAEPQNMTHCQNCHEAIHPQCARTFRGYRLCLPCQRTNALDAAEETDHTSDLETYKPTSDDDTQDSDDNIDVKRLVKTNDKPTTPKPPTAPNITLDKAEHSELDEEDGWSIAGKKTTPKETKKPAAAVTTPPIGKELRPQGARSEPRRSSRTKISPTPVKTQLRY